MRLLVSLILILDLSTVSTFHGTASAQSTSWCRPTGDVSGNPACPSVEDVLNSFSGSSLKKPASQKCAAILSGLPDVSKDYKAMIARLIAKGESRKQATQDALKVYGPETAHAMQHYEDCTRNIKVYKLN